MTATGWAEHVDKLAGGWDRMPVQMDAMMEAAGQGGA